MKDFLRVDGTTEDALISSLIVAARQMAERMTGCVFISQTWELWLDVFPSQRRPGADWWDGMREGPLTDLTQAIRHIEIPKAPLQSVAFFKTFDTSNTESTFDAANYFVDSVSTPGRVVLNSGSVWPSTALRPANGICIRFVAGYGNASAVPEQIKQAIKMIAGHWFENREAVVTGTISKEVEFGAKALLQSFEVMRL
jgi:hypothetical protein